MFRVDQGTYLGDGTYDLFKWSRSDSAHDPSEPWTAESRFNEGNLLALYLASSASGAVAEYLRRFPEFGDMQDVLSIRVNRIRVVIDGRVLDLRAVADQELVGISRQQLTSSESNESARYAATRLLGMEAANDGIEGIAYPSAAARWVGAWNLVLFRLRELSGWHATTTGDEPRPHVPMSEVLPLES